MRLLNKKVVTLIVITLSCVILLQSGVPNKDEYLKESKKIVVKNTENTENSSKNEDSIIEFNEKTSEISSDNTLDLNHLKANNIDAYFRTLQAKSMQDQEKAQEDLSREERKELAKSKIKKALIQHLSE